MKELITYFKYKYYLARVSFLYQSYCNILHRFLCYSSLSTIDRVKCYAEQPLVEDAVLELLLPHQLNFSPLMENFLANSCAKEINSFNFDLLEMCQLQCCLIVNLLLTRGVFNIVFFLLQTHCSNCNTFNALEIVDASGILEDVVMIIMRQLSLRMCLNKLVNFDL